MADVIRVGDIKKGDTVVVNNGVYRVMDFQHVKPGKGSPFVRTTLKNIMTGGVVEDAYKPDDKFEKAYIERKKMMYLYNDGDLYYFMDEETGDQPAAPMNDLKDSMKFVMDGTYVSVSLYQGNIFDVTPEKTVTLEVVECEPGVAGNTATNATKPCVVSTGAKVNVPLFVNQGDFIVVDTETGDYSKRA